MTRPDEIRALAQSLMTARQTGLPVTFQASEAFSYEAALQVQRLVQEELGAVSGFKVGRYEPGRPIIAPIPEVYTYAAGAAVPFKGSIGVELEIGFRLNKELAGYERRRVAEYFTPFVVMELVTSRIAEPVGHPLHKLADMQAGYGLVIGSEVTDWAGDDFHSVEVSLVANGEPLVQGEVALPNGSALTSLEMAIEGVGEHAGGLQPGQMVITGTLTGIKMFDASTQVQAEISGLGNVAFELSKA